MSKLKYGVLILIGVIGIPAVGFYLTYYIRDYTSLLDPIGHCLYKHTEYVELTQPYQIEVIQQNIASQKIKAKNHLSGFDIALTGQYRGSIDLISPNYNSSKWKVHAFFDDCTYPTGPLVKTLKDKLAQLGIENEWVKADKIKQLHTMGYFNQ